MSHFGQEEAARRKRKGILKKISMVKGSAPDKVDERVHLPEVSTVTVNPRVPAGSHMGIATSHTHLQEVSPVAGVAAAKGRMEPRVLGNVLAQVL